MNLLQRIPDAFHNLLILAVREAERLNGQLWLVGGVVRDLMLGRPLTRDLDLAVEGDALALAPALASAAGGRVAATHTPFGTATVLVPDRSGQTLVVDLARTRVERYARPAVLPEVRPASIEADLIRRDFSINAMALGLRMEHGVLKSGQLLDPFGGRQDLSARRLRLLHNDSLRDDPTRMLRGLRIAARLDLTLEAATAVQIGHALAAKYLSLLTPERILTELCLALEEPRPDATLQLAVAWDVSPQILPGLVWSNELHNRFARLDLDIAAGRMPAEGLLVRAGLLLYDLSEDRLHELGLRYPLPAEATTLMRQIAPLRAMAATLAGLSASELDRELRQFSAEALTVLHYAEPGAAAATAHYLQKLRPMRAPLDGNDLRRLGITPGPGLGQLLEALRAATLDGEVVTREDAECWVRGRLSSNG